MIGWEVKVKNEHYIVIEYREKETWDRVVYLEELLLLPKQIVENIYRQQDGLIEKSWVEDNGLKIRKKPEEDWDCVLISTNDIFNFTTKTFVVIERRW